LISGADETQRQTAWSVGSAGLILNTADSQPEKQSRRPTVLVVEDDIVIRKPLAEYLQGAGYSTLETANAAEAIALFSARALIDIVFSDIQMPGPIDGLDLARWIRRDHPGVRVALTSGVANEALAAEVAEIFVAKPYQMAEVAAWIGRLLADPPPPSRPVPPGPSAPDLAVAPSPTIRRPRNHKTARGGSIVATSRRR
jgi:two-component system, response regulator PdtaR